MKTREALSGGTSRVLPVVGETADRIRVVISGGDGRFAAWVSRDTIRTSIISGTELVIGAMSNGSNAPRGAANGDALIYLEAGAPVSTLEVVDNNAHIVVADDVIQATGWVPANSIGLVWTEERRATSNDKHATQDVRRGASIQSGPTSRSYAIARVNVDSPISIIRVTPGWNEVRLKHEHVVVHGFVDQAAIAEHSAPAEVPPIKPTGPFEMPTGTCLYDGIDGEVIGVATSGSVQSERQLEVAHGWWVVGVDSDIGVVELLVRSTSDPPSHKFELCE